ncbi:hypothetical protein D9M68_17520 [compost metagenome]
MGFTTLFKVLKALALFLREMWLRDRTFRQFVNENTPLIFAYSGFLCMTILFGHLYIIVREQEAIIEEHVRVQASLQLDLDSKLPLLTEQVAWYKERYYELKSNPVPEVARVKTPGPISRPSRQPRPKPVEDKPAATRPPSSDIAERWRRLSE